MDKNDQDAANFAGSESYPNVAPRNEPRREFGSYIEESEAIQEATVKAISAVARRRVGEIIPEENTRRFTHGTGWIRI